MGLELPSPVSATCHVERGRTSDGARGALLAQSTARPAWAQRPPLSALGSKNEPLAPLMHRQCAPPGMQSAHHFAHDHTAVSASSNNVPFSIRSSAPLFGSLPGMGSGLSLEGRSGRMLSAGIHGAASQSGGRFASALMALATRALTASAAHRVARGLGGSQGGHVSRCGAGAAPMLAPPFGRGLRGPRVTRFLCLCLEAPTSAALCFSLTASTPAAPRPWG